MKKQWAEKVCELCKKPFSVMPYRAETARTCSRVCHNTRIARENAPIWGEALRYGGNRVGYVKLNGRHMHRVVAERMLGRALREGEIVHHLDRNKQNNDPSNLRVMTQSEHISQHRKEMPVPSGENHCHAKLTENAVLQIRSTDGSAYSLKWMAEKFGVHVVTVRCAYNRKTWRHIP